MGVVYKLTPEVSSFIIDQKRNDPKITCQNLAGTVFLRFGQKVSKSSVHELLKQSRVITPRPRKTKEKFQIPNQKKAEISKSLAPFTELPASEMLIPASDPVSEPTAPVFVPAPEPTASVSLEERVVSSPTLETPAFVPDSVPEVEVGSIQQSDVPSQGEIFLKCVLWDLSFKPVLGLNDFSDANSISYGKVKGEWDYLTQPIFAIKIETASHSFYVDPRFQGMYMNHPSLEDFSVPIERAAAEVTDCLVNNVEPLILKEIKDIDFPTAVHFFAAFENKEPLKKVSLLGVKENAFVEFEDPMTYKRKFISEISCNYKEIQWFIESQEQESLWEMPFLEPLKVRLLKNDKNIIITNVFTETYEEIWNKYRMRHPSSFLLSVKSFQNFSIKKEDLLIEKIKERAFMFFPSGTTTFILNEILALAGREDQGTVHLAIPPNFLYKAQVQHAAENANNLYIKNSNGQIVRITIEE
jgi:hypothetical protein